MPRSYKLVEMQSIRATSFKKRNLALAGLRFFIGRMIIEFKRYKQQTTFMVKFS